MASLRGLSWQLAPLLFNIYTFDLPITIFRKHAYADDLAIMHTDGNWQAVEKVLRKDMATIGNTSRSGSQTQHYKNGVVSLPSQQGS